MKKLVKFLVLILIGPAFADHAGGCDLQFKIDTTGSDHAGFSVLDPGPVRARSRSSARLLSG